MSNDTSAKVVALLSEEVDRPSSLAPAAEIVTEVRVSIRTSVSAKSRAATDHDFA